MGDLKGSTRSPQLVGCLTVAPVVGQSGREPAGGRRALTRCWHCNWTLGPVGSLPCPSGTAGCSQPGRPGPSLSRGGWHTAADIPGTQRQWHWQHGATWKTPNAGSGCSSAWRPCTTRPTPGTGAAGGQAARTRQSPRAEPERVQAKTLAVIMETEPGSPRCRPGNLFPLLLSGESRTSLCRWPFPLRAHLHNANLGEVREQQTSQPHPRPAALGGRQLTHVKHFQVEKLELLFSGSALSVLFLSTASLLAARKCSRDLPAKR